MRVRGKVARLPLPLLCGEFLTSRRKRLDGWMGLEAGDNIMEKTVAFHILTIHKIHGGGRGEKEKNLFNLVVKVVVVLILLLLNV